MLETTPPNSFIEDASSDEPYMTPEAMARRQERADRLAEEGAKSERRIQESQRLAIWGLHEVAQKNPQVRVEAEIETVVQRHAARHNRTLQTY